MCPVANFHNPFPKALQEILQQNNSRRLFAAQKKLGLSMRHLQLAIAEPTKSYIYYQEAIALCEELEPSIKWNFMSYEDLQSFFLVVPLQDEHPDIWNLLYQRNIKTISYEEYQTLLEFYKKFTEDSKCSE